MYSPTGPGLRSSQLTLKVTSFISAVSIAVPAPGSRAYPRSRRDAGRRSRRHTSESELERAATAPLLDLARFFVRADFVVTRFDLRGIWLPEVVFKNVNQGRARSLILPRL